MPPACIRGVKKSNSMFPLHFLAPLNRFAPTDACNAPASRRSRRCLPNSPKRPNKRLLILTPMGSVHPFVNATNGIGSSASIPSSHFYKTMNSSFVPRRWFRCQPLDPPKKASLSLPTVPAGRGSGRTMGVWRVSIWASTSPPACPNSRVSSTKN